ncbi:MAG: hypothetical protein ACI8WT_004819 [Clostridium sp.]
MTCYKKSRNIEIPFRNSSFANIKFSWACQDDRLANLRQDAECITINNCYVPPENYPEENGREFYICKRLEFLNGISVSNYYCKTRRRTYFLSLSLFFILSNTSLKLSSSTFTTATSCGTSLGTITIPSLLFPVTLL